LALTATVIRPRFNPRKRAAQQRATERDELMARIIFRSIERELRDVEFFTREDLLQLTVLQSVATITRYHEVCVAVMYLIETRKLLAVSRTELCLYGHVTEARKNSGSNLVDNYMNTIKRLVTHYRADHPRSQFNVMDIVAAWRQDQHLTQNAKRVAVRIGLRRLRKTEDVTYDAETLSYS
jgi:hypothetical protein